MQLPVSVDVDLVIGAAYVQYLVDREVCETVDVWKQGQVAADLDANGAVIGIELLRLDDATIGQARLFAEKSCLAFPHNLAGNMVANSVSVS